MYGFILLSLRPPFSATLSPKMALPVIWTTDTFNSRWWSCDIWAWWIRFLTQYHTPHPYEVLMSPSVSYARVNQEERVTKLSFCECFLKVRLNLLKCDW